MLPKSGRDAFVLTLALTQKIRTIELDGKTVKLQIVGFAIRKNLA